MRKIIKNATIEDLDNFEGLTNPIVRFLRENWNVKELGPQGYNEYRKTYEGGDDMGEMIPEFSGFLDNSASKPTLPVMLSMPQVAYSDVEQGYTPLETLVGALVGYGLAVGEQRSKLNEAELEKKIRNQIKLEQLEEKYKDFGL
jgi:hypothetical protein